jgi:hypothetical protein
MQATQIASAAQMSTHATFTWSLLLETECVVDDRVHAGISVCPMGEEAEGRTRNDIDAERWCLSVKTPGGRQRETTSLLIPS